MAPIYGERWTAGCLNCHYRGRRVLLGWITWTGPEPTFSRYVQSKGADTHGVDFNRSDTTVRCRQCKSTLSILAADLRHAVRRHAGGWDQDVLL